MSRDVHQCPSCELRFWYRTELEDHIRHDHPDQADLVDHDLYRPAPPRPDDDGPS